MPKYVSFYGAIHKVSIVADTTQDALQAFAQQLFGETPDPRVTDEVVNGLECFDAQVGQVIRDNDPRDEWMRKLTGYPVVLEEGDGPLLASLAESGYCDDAGLSWVRDEITGALVAAVTSTVQRGT